MSFRQFFSSKLRTEHNDFVGKNGSITYFNGNLYYHDGRTPGGLRIDQDTGVGGEALATEDYVDNRIEQVIDLAPAALDTLKELAQALGNNADFATSITNLLADKASILYVDTEITNLTSSVNASLATKASITYVDSEINELHDAVNSSINLLQAAIDAEVIDRANGDNTLQNNINAEANAREDADTILQNNINAEALARGTADNNLQANINTLSTQLSSETQARQNADNSLTSLINAETTARLQADGNLAGDIADEANARSSADAALLTAINLESTARESLRTSLEGQITAERNDRIDDVNDLQANLQTEIVNRINAVNAEATIRANADNGLQTAITNEANARVQGDQDLQSIIDAVESSYIAADANLTARITQEIVDRTAAVSAEATARTSADTNLQNQIDFIKENIDPAALDSLKEIVAAFQGEDLNIANSIATINTTLVTLQGANATETAARQAADTTLQNNINAEATTRANADASLQSQIDNIISNIDPAQLDSLSEIVAAFQTADGSLTNTINNLQTTLQGNINDVASDLATETTNRTNADLSLQQNINTEASDRAAADQTLQNNIDAEATARVNAVNGLQSSLNTEITNRQSADTILQNNITAEATARQTSDQSILDSLNQEILDRQTAVSDEALARQSADATLQNNIDAEATARTNADNTLQSNIDAEALARQGADATLQNNIDAEATARQGADNTLQGNIDAEESARIAADSTLQTNISDEAIARQTGDTNLQNQIDDIRSNLDPAALDSLTEIVAAFQSGDLDIANNIATINSTLIDLQSADTTLQNNIDTEANARQTDILNEALARESADTNLQNQIDDIKSNLDPAALDSLTEIVAAFQSGDLDIANNIATINTTLTNLQSADTGLQTDIDAIAADLAAETLNRSNTDANLQSQIDSIKSNLDPAALDSLTEIVAAFQSGDTNLLSDLSNVSTALNTKLNTADFNTTADTWLGTKTMFTVTDAPTNNTDAANKSYVDSQISNFSTFSISNGASSASLPVTDGNFVINLDDGSAEWAFNTAGGITFPDGTVQTTAWVTEGGSGSYKGFKAHYGRMYDNNDDPNGPINKIVIYKDTVSPSSSIDTGTDNDFFEVTGLAGSDVVAMIVAVGQNITATPITELKTFAESIIDNVILNGGVEGNVNSVDNMKTQFYANFATFSATLSDLKTNLDFFSINTNFNISPSYTTTGGATFYGFDYNMSNDTVTLGGWGNGTGHNDGDVFVIPGTQIQDANGNFLSSPSNDVTVTVTSTSGGMIQNYTVTGTLPRPLEIWPTDNIDDGGDDEYDNANYISTNIQSNIPYNNGNASYGDSAFGGGDYVVTYKDSIFGVFAVNAFIETISTSGNSGFDGSGVADTGVLFTGGNSIELGNFVFNNDTITVNTNGSEDLFVKALDDLYLDALDDDVLVRANDDIRLRTGYNFTADLYAWELRFNNQGEIILYNSNEGNDYGTIRPVNNGGTLELSLESTGRLYVKTNNGNNSWKFDTDGSLTFPDGTIQNTAYSGADTLDAVTDNGATTTNVITVGGVNTNHVVGVIAPATGAQITGLRAPDGYGANNGVVYVGSLTGLESLGDLTGYIVTREQDGASTTVVGMRPELMGTPGFEVADGSIWNPANTYTYTSPTYLAARTGSVNFIPNSSGDGAGYGTIELRPDSGATQDQYLIVDPTAPNHIHIRGGGTQNSSNADLFLGGEKNYVKVSDPVDLVEISVDDTNGGNWYWQFNSSGQLAVPGAVNFLQNSTIPLGPPQAGGGTDRVRLWDFFGGGSNFNYAIGAEGNHVWFAMDVNNGTGGFKFYSRDNQVFKIRDDGALMFADATTQTTAYPGTSILNGYATETYVNNAVAAVVDSAPEVLNTLNELAAALGDNPDFVTTITGQIGLKANSADVYLKTETYTQTEINNALGLKANSADVYTSLQVDSALALKANSADVYLKTETYTQSEINNALGLKADTSSLAAVATSGDYDDLSNRIPYSTLGALTNRTIQVGAGTLSYTPTIETGLVAAGNHTGTYAGLTVQNNNAGATSSANIYFSNTGANETADFAVIGLNGPNYNFGYDTVDGAKKLLYIANTDGDIVLIPNLFGAGNTHFGYAGGSAAISVTNGGGLSLGTTWNNAGQTYVLNEGTAGQILTSGGTGQPVTWSTPAPQNQLVAGATSLTLDSSGKITLPQGSVINESGSVSCATGIATAIYTATSSNMTTIKLLVQVEEFAGTTQIQSSEIMAIKAFGTNTVASSIYGTVYSSAGPLATFTAELDGSNNIVIKCQPTGANTLTARVVATEIVTSD